MQITGSTIEITLAVSLAVSLLNTIIILIVGYLQSRRQTRVERELRLLSTGVDQSIQLLHRAREAVIGMHRTHVLLLSLVESKGAPNPTHLEKFAEYSAHFAELRGLAVAINDTELLNLVNTFGFETPLGEQKLSTDEARIRGASEQAHTRIAQLLKEATKNK